jgi:hypothetical protein
VTQISSRLMIPSFNAADMPIPTPRSLPYTAAVSICRNPFPSAVFTAPRVALMMVGLLAAVLPIDHPPIPNVPRPRIGSAFTSPFPLMAEYSCASARKVGEEKRSMYTESILILILMPGVDRNRLY